MKKLLLTISVVALLAAGCNSAPVNTDQTTKTFTNSSGQYAFEYHADWEAVQNQNINTNTLFGPNATATSGLGGVEVFSNQTSIDSFLNGTDAEFSNRTNVTVDGASGVHAQYTGIVRGESVSILKDGKIYHLYINSENSEDVRNFDQIVATFKFVQ